MAITVGTVTTNAWGGAYPYTHSFTATVDAGCTAILVFLSTASNDASWNPTVTIGGKAMTLVRRAASTNQGVMWCFGLGNSAPAISGSVTVQITKSDQYADIGHDAVVCLSGTDTTAPFEAHGGAAGTNTSIATITTLTADDLIVGAGFTHYNPGTPSCTSPSGTVTSIYSRTSNPNHQGFGFALPVATAGTHTLTYTTTNYSSSTNPTAFIAVAVKLGGGTTFNKSLTAAMSSFNVTAVNLLRDSQTIPSANWSIVGGGAGIAGNVNILRHSEAFDNPVWVPLSASATVVTADAASGPNGVSEADRVVCTGTSGYLAQATPVLPRGSKWTLSVYAKVEANVTFIGLRLVDNAITQVLRLDTATGAVSLVGGGVVPGYIAHPRVDAGGGWYRYAVTFVVSATSGVAKNEVSVGWGDANASLLFWGVQFNEGSAPVNYTSAAPDGTQTATLIAATTTSTGYQQQTGVLTRGAKYTASAHFKATSNTTQFSLRLQDGTNQQMVRWAVSNMATTLSGMQAGYTLHTPENLGNGWWRVAVTFVVSATNTNVTGHNLTAWHVGSIPATYYLWGVQLNAGDVRLAYQKTPVTTGGSLSNRTSKLITAAKAVWSGASLSKRTSKLIAAAMSSFAVSGMKRAGKTLASAQSPFSAAAIKTPSKILAAARSPFSASVSRRIGKRLSATQAAFSASVSKKTAKLIAAATAAWSGTVGRAFQAGAQVFQVALTAAMSAWAGNSRRHVSKRNTAQLAPWSATAKRRIGKLLAATRAAFSGSLNRSTVKKLTAVRAPFAATVTRRIDKRITAARAAWSATLDTSKLVGAILYTVDLAASMSEWTGGTIRRTGQTLAASLAQFSASRSFRVSKRLAALRAPFSGLRTVLVRRRILASRAPFAASLSSARVIVLLLASVMGSWSAARRARTGKRISATQEQFSASLSRSITQRMAASMAAFPGRITKRIARRPFEAAMSWWSALVNRITAGRVPVPDDRRMEVEAESRSILVDPDVRSMSIDPDDRTIRF